MIRRVVIASLVLVALLEGTSAVGIAVLNRVLDEPIRRPRTIYREQSDRIAAFLAAPESTHSVILDASLGWRYRPGFTSATDTISAQGLRASHDYAPHAAAGVQRIAAFGDSFTYGNEVGNDDAWTTVLERLGPGMEVLNYGVGGYGLDQAYLRYQTEGRDLAPSVVLIGFVPDDLGRLVNRYRRLTSTRESPLFKPRFLLEGDSLLLLPAPVQAPGDYAKYQASPDAIRELRGTDLWYRPSVYDNPLANWSATVRLGSALVSRVYARVLDPNRLSNHGTLNPGSSAFRLQVAILDRFAASVRSRNAQPLVILFPDQTVVRQGLAGEPLIYSTLHDSLTAHGIPTLDLAEAFLDAAGSDPSTLFAPGGHHSPKGAAVVANALRARLAVP